MSNFDNLIDEQLDRSSIHLQKLRQNAVEMNHMLDEQDGKLNQLHNNVVDSSNATQVAIRKIKKVLGNDRTCCKGVSIVLLAILCIILMFVLIYS